MKKVKEINIAIFEDRNIRKIRISMKSGNKFFGVIKPLPLSSL